MANIYGRQVIVVLTNKSGGGVIAGDVVVVDTTNNDAFTTTTAGQSTVSVGVAQETIASNASGRVLISGYAALVNVPSSMTRGYYLQTHTVAKQATGNSARQTGSFGQFLTGGTTPDAMLWGGPDVSGAAASIVTVDAVLGGDQTMTTANTFYDGPSASFGAGTWLITYKAVFALATTGQTHDVTIKLWDGSTLYDESGNGCNANTSATIGFEVAGCAIVTLAGSATLKISATDIRNSTVMKRDVTSNTGSTHFATRLCGYKVS